MLAVSFAVQAQTKFHDVEANGATGPVKSISRIVNGEQVIFHFTKEGKQVDEMISDAVYDDNGYLKSLKRSVMGQKFTEVYTWENGKVISQTIDAMGQKMVFKRTYNEKGAPEAEIMNMGGREMKTPYTDYKYDDYGNWISRKSSRMGQETEETRKIEYYTNTQGEIEYYENPRVEFLKNRIKSIDGYSAKYIKKYGKTAGNALYKGRFVGLSFVAVNEFVKDLNSMAEEGKKYVLKAYEPTTSDVIRYGRGVKRYTLFSVGTFAINLTEIKVLNGKVIVQRDDYYGGMEELKHSDLEALDLY